MCLLDGFHLWQDRRVAGAGRGVAAGAVSGGAVEHQVHGQRHRPRRHRPPAVEALVTAAAQCGRDRIILGLIASFGTSSRRQRRLGHY